VLTVLAGVAAASPVVAQLGGGTFRGQVTDSLGIAVAHAEVAILSTNLRVVADSDGVFRIPGVPVGLHGVVVRAIGWKPLFFLIRMEEGQEQVARVGLEPAPVRLPEIVVQGGRFAKPPEYAFTTRYDDFFRRRRVRQGTFRTRSDPVFGRAIATGDLLQMIPGVRVSFGEGGTTVWFSRCSGPGARVAVWIDGARVMTGDHNEALSYLRPNDIEMIEVYRSGGQIPGEFLADSCAAIVIWTR